VSPPKVNSPKPISAKYLVSQISNSTTNNAAKRVLFIFTVTHVPVVRFPPEANKRIITNRFCDPKKIRPEADISLKKVLSAAHDTVLSALVGIFFHPPSGEIRNKKHIQKTPSLSAAPQGVRRDKTGSPEGVLRDECGREGYECMACNVLLSSVMTLANLLTLVGLTM